MFLTRSRRSGIPREVSFPTAPFPLASSPPLTVTVVSVVWQDANKALWTFSSALVSDPVQIDGLVIAGQLPGGADGETPEGAVYITYDDPISVGEAWTCDATQVVATFANGGTLVSGGGVVA